MKPRPLPCGYCDNCLKFGVLQIHAPCLNPQLKKKKWEVMLDNPFTN